MTMGKRVAATSAENSLPSGTLVRKGSDRSVTTHGWLRMAKVATILLFLGWSVGQVCLDATWFTGLLFYIPSPAIFAILGTGTVLGLRGATGESSQRISITTVMALLAAGIMTFGVENQVPLPATIPGAILSTGELLFGKVDSDNYRGPDDRCTLVTLGRFRCRFTRSTSASSVAT